MLYRLKNTVTNQFPSLSNMKISTEKSRVSGSFRVPRQIFTVPGIFFAVADRFRLSVRFLVLNEIKHVIDAADNVVKHQPHPSSNPAPQMTPSKVTNSPQSLLTMKSPNICTKQCATSSEEALRKGTLIIDGLEKIPGRGYDWADDTLRLSGGEFGGLRPGFLGLLRRRARTQSLLQSFVEGELGRPLSYVFDVSAADAVDVKLDPLFNSAGESAGAEVEAVEKCEPPAFG